MAKSTYSKYPKKSPLTPDEKDEIIKEGSEKVESFLKEKVIRIISALQEQNEKSYIWNSPVFQVKYSNPSSGTVYNTENSLILSILSEDKNYSLPFYLTAKQGFDAGMSNKGEKSDYIVHRFGMDFGPLKEKNNETGEYDFKRDEEGNIQHIFKRACKLTPVFNISQFTGEMPERFQKIIKENTAKIPTDKEISIVFDAILETMPTKLKRSIDPEGRHNKYIPSIDIIYMAPSELFKSKLHEISTLLHEVSHSYGHSSRKNRESLAKYGEDPKYKSYEELVANLSAQAVIKHFNFKIGNDEQDELNKMFKDNHDTYDTVYALNLFYKEPLSIFKAAADADRTANEIIFKVEENLRLKYENNSELEISNFIKERLNNKIDNEEDLKNNKSKNKIKPK